jgi:DNA integrity scanning protein DisA with diadenylate cyclase activity
MAKTKPSRLKKVEEQIKAIVVELQKMGHYLNLTMNTINEYIDFKKDIKKFENYTKKKAEELEKSKKSLDKKEK